MTPREFHVEVDAEKQRIRDEVQYHAQRDLALAWQGVAFYTQAIAGKFPTDLPAVLAKVTTTVAAPKKPSIEQQQAQFAMLSVHLGVPMRPMSPEARQALDRLRARETVTHG